ncbi:flagellar basal body rod protein FlgB [Altererythrobacter sp. Z27]|uniref:flagellar basal body rod protein FlgB n=1 Tax=Altererythrobacter sp. Z27 TaxID=3461147 RepID=UPI004044CFA1
MSELSQIVTIKVMDALVQRQSAIAQNIANSGSVAYARKVVDFEAALQAAFLQGPDAVRTFVPRMTTLGSAQSGGEIRLDLEMQGASATAMRFAALSDILGRQMSLAHLVVRGGQ